MFGSKRTLIRLQNATERRKTEDPRLARGGEEVTGGRRKGCLEGRQRQKTPKNALVGLGWHKQRWRVAKRRQARLKVEARGRKVLIVPSRACADTVDRKALGDGEGDWNETRSLKGFPELIHG
ncbi:hypothetical protein CK203_043988 [Vitis vinifera]|uniref:Uncharacterized protein n=1 Tax=Vitis vinifera TaxID=29760 RepID=A0A438HTI5_VITVI|nr:hypothetical protein CK203_043988 [Vitis vinifera]